MTKSFVISIALWSSIRLVTFLHASRQGDPSPNHEPETSTLLVLAEDKKANKVVVGATVLVRWGKDFTENSKSEQDRTLDTGIAKFPKIPREKVRIQVIASKFKTSTCLYDIKKAEEKIGIQLGEDAEEAADTAPGLKKDTTLPACVAIPNSLR